MKDSASGVERVRRALALLVFAVSAYFVPGASWSPVSRFCLTRAIVERGSFEITPDASSTGDRAQVGERFYTDKAPVPSLLAVPAYALLHAVAKASGSLPAYRATGTPDRPARVVVPNAAFQRGLYVCTISTAGVAAAALAYAIFGVLRRRGVPLVPAALATGATSLATPLFAYGASFFDHTIAAAFLFGAFACAPRRLPLAGAFLALAVGTEYVVAVFAAMVFSFIVVAAPRAERARTAGWVILGAVLPLFVLGAYHAACFGAPYRTGYSFITNASFAAGQESGFFGIAWPRAEALFGLLLGGSRGLFIAAPITTVGLFAAVTDVRRQRNAATILCLTLFTTAWLVNAGYFMWTGGRAFGPRHMVPVLGFLALGIATAFERHPSVSAAAAGISAFIVLFTTAVGLEVPSGVNVVLDYLVPALREGRIARAPGASNLGLLLGLSARGSLVLLAGIVLAGAFVVSRLVARASSEGPERGEP